VGDSLGMCRFTTKLFNSPSLPGYDELARQVGNVTGLEFTPEQLDEAGHNINGVERLLNHRLGVRRRDDTLPERWFEEPIPVGPYAGERIDRQEFEALLDRFYALSDLDEEGIPRQPWRDRLRAVLEGAGP